MVNEERAPPVGERCSEVKRASRCRAAEKMPVRQIAEELGVTTSYIIGWEDKQRTTLVVEKRLARA
jgi:hypothetical protein